MINRRALTGLAAGGLASAAGPSAAQPTPLMEGRSVLDFIPTALHPRILDGLGEADLSGGIQSAFDWAVAQPGGARLIFPPGRYHLARTVTLRRPDPRFATIGVMAQGAVFTSSGRNYVIRLQDGGAESALIWDGGQFNHYPKTDARGVFHLVGSSNVTFRDVFILVGTPTDPDYAGYRIEPLDPNNDDTGTFWVRWPGSRFRGTDPDAWPANGVWSTGANNDLDLGGSWWSVVKRAILLDPGPSRGAVAGSLANGVRVVNATIEGVDQVVLARANSRRARDAYGPYGLVIANSRFEAVLDAVLRVEGATLNVHQPPLVAHNCLLQNVARVVAAPEGLHATIVQPSWGGEVAPSSMHFDAGLRLQGRRGGSLSLIDEPGFGLEWLKSDGRRLAHARGSTTDPVFELGGHVGGGVTLALTGLGGLSRGGAVSRNLAGQSPALSRGQAQVTFPEPQPGASYRVALTANGPIAAPLYVTRKTPTGFMINTNDPQSRATVDWILIQD